MMKKLKYFLLVLMVLFTLSVFGQFSEGGLPMDISELKSAKVHEEIVRMPAFDIARERKASMNSAQEKTVKFAHSFNVAMNPDNSGNWYTIGNYRIWQLKVASANAYSIGLIFTKYHVPEGARLFIFDVNKETIYGAFTARNNKSYNKLAIYPFPSDEVVIQYEESINAAFHGELELGGVNHDYLGIVSKSNRWPERSSESCNVDVNCETDSGLEEQKRSVCRILSGNELGTGTLLNNSEMDGTPYVISAYHVYDKYGNYKEIDSLANISVFDFNYESPFCASIDGYDLQTISGSDVLAMFDSLDFMLVKLSEEIPASYRPYFAGWDASGTVPSDSYVIHHPNGDVKKITHDTGTCDSMTFAGSYKKYGHWKVLNYETGTTEAGSSGAGLFSNKRVFGTLSGGAASCTNLAYDAFARLDKMWNYRSEPERQIKVWLDSKNTGVTKLDGLDPFEKELSSCTLISNYLVEDVTAHVSDELSSHTVTEIAERFTQTSTATLDGVALGIKSFNITSTDPQLSIIIYSGDEKPEYAEKIYKFSMNKLTADAMNYFSFGEGVQMKGIFFVSIEVNSRDSITFFQSVPRSIVSLSTMLVKEDDSWKNFSEVNPEGKGASLLMQVNVCGVNFAQAIDTIDDPQYMKYYPNPATSYLIVEFYDQKAVNELSIYDLTGRMMYNDCYQNRSYAELSLDGFDPGIYIIQLVSDQQKESHRLLIK